MEGYLEDKLSIYSRLIALIAADMMLWPNLDLWIQCIGLAAFLVLFVIGNKSYKKNM
jgi:membrane protein implicated in regulation of membrane protease activity